MRLENLALESLKSEHLDALFALKNDPEVLRWVPGVYPLDREAFGKKYLRWLQGPSLQDGSFVILSGAEILGEVAYFHREGREGCELGYFVGRSWWGRGIASTALRLCLINMRGFGLSGLVYASHAPENLASGRVLEKAGFERAGEVGFPQLDGSVVMDSRWARDIGPRPLEFENI